MYKIFIFSIITLFSVLPFSLLAIETAPSDTIQQSELGSRKIRWSKIFQQKIQFNLGFDLEPTHKTRIESVGIKPIVNLGLSYQFNVGSRWAIRPEIWYQQFSTPSITVITDNKYETDGVRIQSVDTTTLLRMAGYNLGITVIRHLPANFSILGGVQCGWYKKGITEYGGYTSDLNGGTSRYYSGSISPYKAIPNWVETMQPGLKIGLEKKIGKLLVLGVCMYQSLRDLTNFPEGGKNYSSNFVGYLGVRL